MPTGPQKAQTEVIAPRMQPGATLVAPPHLRLLPTAAALSCGGPAAWHARISAQDVRPVDGHQCGSCLSHAPSSPETVTGPKNLTAQPATDERSNPVCTPDGQTAAPTPSD